MHYVGPRQIVIDNLPESETAPVWEPDLRFKDQVVAVIGGGPSHGNLDLEILRGHRFIAVNSSCRKVRPVATKDDMLYFSDNSWNENRPELVDTWPGFAVTSNRNAKMRLGTKVLRIDISELVKRFEVFPDWVYTSSGHASTVLAAALGARKLVLIGFESQVVGGRTHGHDDYYQHDVSAFSHRYLPAWEGLSLLFRRLNLEVVNSTPDSAILDFPFQPFAEAIG